MNVIRFHPFPEFTTRRDPINRLIDDAAQPHADGGPANREGSLTCD